MLNIGGHVFKTGESVRCNSLLFYCAYYEKKKKTPLPKLISQSSFVLDNCAVYSLFLHSLRTPKFYIEQKIYSRVFVIVKKYSHGL